MDSQYNCVTLSSGDSDENEEIPKEINSANKKTYCLSEPRKQNGNNVDKEKKEEIDKKEDENLQYKLQTVNNTLYKNKVVMLPENNGTECKQRIQPVVLDTKESEREVVKKKLDTFLQVCKQNCRSHLEMVKVQERLLKAYENADPEYIRSAQFQNVLSKEIKAISSDREPWCNIKTIMDELKSNKLHGTTINRKKKEDIKKDSKPSSSRPVENDEDDNVSDDDIEHSKIKDAKTRKHLKKLEKTMKLLNKKIKHLEEKEVNWSDDEDSCYIKLDRYRAHICKVYKKICEIRGKLADAQRPYLRKISFSGSSYPDINRVIEKFYNKNREFPDFHDIKKLVQQVSGSKNINFTPIKIHQVAAAAFKEFGEQLKRLRQYDDHDILCSYLESHVDPAEKNFELEEKLRANAELGKKRLQNVIDEFADKTIDDMFRASVSESEQDSEEVDSLVGVSKSNTSYADKFHHSSEDGESDDNKNSHVSKHHDGKVSKHISKKNSKRKTDDDDDDSDNGDDDDDMYEEEDCANNKEISLAKFTSSLQLAPRKTKRIRSDSDGDEQYPPVIKKPKINSETDSLMDNANQSDKNEHSSKNDSETDLESDVSEIKSEKYINQMCMPNNISDKTDNSSEDTDITYKNEDIEELRSIDKRKQDLNTHHVNIIVQKDVNNTNNSSQGHCPIITDRRDCEKTQSSDIKCITLENSPERKDSDSDEIDVIVEIPRKIQGIANADLLRRRAETSDICIIHETKPVAQPMAKKSWICKREQKSDQLKYAGSSGKYKVQQTQPKPFSAHYFPNGSTKFVNNTAIQNVIKSGTTKVCTKSVNSSVKSDAKEIIILD